MNFQEKDSQKNSEIAKFSDSENPLRKIKVLLVKPFQFIPAPTQQPPVGLLYIAASIREQLGNFVEVKILDMKLHEMETGEIGKILTEFPADVVGFSCLNYEAGAGHRLAAKIKEINSKIITVFGGPYALKNPITILEDKNADWVFEGSAERSFTEALKRLCQNISPDKDILGMSFRDQDGKVYISTKQDQINDLDSLPPPAWDLVDLDFYATKPNMATVLKGKRYAVLFTSRGCPYLCNYCHDIFSKKFVYHSVDYVIAEIARLYDEYGVDEFQIVDDIFNLHKRRVKDIMKKVQERWPGKLKFSFPNGLRADILDEEVINAMCDAGTYAASIAIETVTPRLQNLIEKHLNIEKACNAIALFGKRKVRTTGFFMLGFPTETPEEMQATLDFAFKSKLTMAYFFTVVPQFGTPLYNLSLSENATITEDRGTADTGLYRTPASWYQQAYGYPLSKKIKNAHLRFYFSPFRIFGIIRHYNFVSLLRCFKMFLRIIVTS